MRLVITFTILLWCCLGLKSPVFPVSEEEGQCGDNSKGCNKDEKLCCHNNICSSDWFFSFLTGKKCSENSICDSDKTHPCHFSIYFIVLPFRT